MKKSAWKKYAVEFFSIFIAVISAFALNNWNDNRRDYQAENKILIEIAHGLEKDIEDVNLNVLGHNFGLRASHFCRQLINNEVTNLDTINAYYFNLTRDYISIQNTSGYENLKSRGLELIKNDSLRTQIISLYEYDYQTLKKLEEDYNEMQFHKNYFKEINDAISPYLKFDDTKGIIGVNRPINLNAKEKNKILSYLWQIDRNRNFILSYYKQIKTNIENLKKHIDEKL